MMNDKNKTKAQLIEEMAVLRQRNAELEAREAEHRRTEQVQAALYRIADAASAAEDMQQFYAAMHQIVGELMYAKNFFIALWDEATDLLSFPYFIDEVDPPPSPRKSGRGATEYVIRTGIPQRQDDDLAAQLIQQREIEVADVGAPSVDWLGVPLKTDEGTIGALVVQSYTEGITYTDQDLTLLNFVGQHIATALERARLREETRQRNAELAIINGVGEGLAKQLEFEAIIDLVGDKISDIFQAHTVAIGFLDPEAELINVPYLLNLGERQSMEPMPFGEGLASHIIRSGEPLVINQDAKRRFTEHGTPYPDDEDGNSIKSWVGVPIMVGDKAIGGISLQDVKENAFSEGDVRLLSTLAANMGVAIENARLFDEIQRTNQDLSQTLKELRTTQGQLVEAEKMAALGGLVAGVAHEINTPVGVGVTAASTLQDKTTNFSEIYKSGQMKRSDLEKYLDLAEQSSAMILRNLERAAELIQSFKQVAVDQSSEERRKFPVKVYLEEILLSLRPQLKKTQHTIEVNGDDSLTLDSYPGAFSQIVTNLVMNSLLHAYGPDEWGQLTFDFKQNDGHLIFEYNDDGKGIPAENLSKIFEPFFTTKRTQGGSGLGLHIIYNLVTQRLGGTINCESEVGSGTKFIIEVPVS